MTISASQEQSWRGTDESASSFIVETDKSIGDQKDSDLEGNKRPVAKWDAFNDFNQIVGAFYHTIGPDVQHRVSYAFGCKMLAVNSGNWKYPELATLIWY